MKSKLYGLLLLLATLAFEVRADNLGYTKEHPLKFAIDLDYPPLPMRPIPGRKWLMIFSIAGLTLV